jgi:hypothetical protein
LAPQINFAQLGPYENILACESAARSAEQVVMAIGAERVGTACTLTKVR